jgi:phosphatidylglycerol:prolipoprotein diacylglycerol transferase
MKQEARGKKREEKAGVDLRRSEVGLVVAGLALLMLLAITVLVPAFRGTLIIHPVAFTAGPVVVRWYGIILASAIAVAFEWSRRRLEARGYRSESIEPILWWAAIGGILGARVGFVVQNLSFFIANPLTILAYTQGGLSIHGAVTGGAIAVWLASRRAVLTRSGDHHPRRGKTFLDVADAVAPTVLLGTIIGRFGNFTNHELYGYPTTLPWKLFIPLADRLPGFELSVFFHPTFLYEALLNLVMLGIVLRFERAASRQPPAVNLTIDSRFTIHDSRLGSTFLLTLALYSVSRFTVEFVRIGDAAIGGLTTAQLLSVVVIGLATPLILLRSRPPTRPSTAA